jgi:hypothetical protein
MTMATTDTTSFGIASYNRNAKIHMAWQRDGEVVTGCLDMSGYWIGKPILKVLETVEHEALGEADDNNRAIDALLQKRPEYVGHICKWCDWFSDFARGRG